MRFSLTRKNHGEIRRVDQLVTKFFEKTGVRPFVLRAREEIKMMNELGFLPGNTWGTDMVRMRGEVLTPEERCFLSTLGQWDGGVSLIEGFVEVFPEWECLYQKLKEDIQEIIGESPP